MAAAADGLARVAPALGAERAAVLAAAAERLRERRHRAGRARRARVREAVGRGRRRRLRGDRLPRVLRALAPRARPVAPDLAQVPGERNTLRYEPAGRRRRDRALELPAGDPDRDDRRPRSRPATRWCSSRPSSRPAARSPSSRPCTRPACRRRRSRCCPARATPARLWSPIRGSTLIAFTGSGAVGLEIVRAAAETAHRPGPPQAGDRRDGRQELRHRRRRRRPRRRRSRRSSPRAFGFAGQKCSAASRVLVHEDDRRGAARSGSRGAARRCSSARPRASATDVPPLIEAEARDRPRRPLSRPRRPRAGAVVPPAPDPPGSRAGSAARRSPPGCPPTRGLCARRSSARCSPWSAVARRRPGARELVDALPFALTGGLFSRNPRDGRARRGTRLPVGNLYVNRGTTGAMVGAPALRRQPPVRHGAQGGRPRLPAPASSSPAWSARTRCATASRPTGPETANGPAR